MTVKKFQEVDWAKESDGTIGNNHHNLEKYKILA